MARNLPGLYFQTFNKSRIPAARNTSGTNFRTRSQLFSKEAFSKLSQGLPSHAEGIIHHCQSAIQSHQDKKRDLDVAKFVALKNGYQSLSRFNSPQTTERESFEKQLKELVKIYEKDDKFLTQIKRLGVKDAHILALDFLKEHTLQKELPQKNLHRGFER